ncbi:MAG: ABC transporter ATP-binding protein [Bacteroidales bacterium]|jgi:iron complex transport system ATP-binding protein
MATVNNSFIITVKDLSFGYHRDKAVLSNVNCNIAEHEFTVIMGKNGSGKSTLLRNIGGIVPYHTGSIKIKGKELKRLHPLRRAGYIGFLAQHHKAVFPFKVKEVVLTGRASYIRYLPKKQDEYETAKAMEMAGIYSLKNRIYSELSGGEQQLVMIARILAQQPDVLLMDEPISHLDYNNQLRIIKMIKQLVKSGVTVVAVLHEPNMAYLFGNRFIYIHNKTAHMVEQENPWEHPLVNEIFHDDLRAVEHKGKYVFIPQLS